MNRLYVGNLAFQAAELNGKELLGRSLRVDLAEERRNAPTSGGGRGRSGGSGGWRAGR